MGRTIESFRIITLALIMGLLLVGLCPQPALADDPPAPANLQIESAKACRHLIEEDDFFLVFHYNIHYAEEDQPDDPANKLFTFRLLDTNGVDHLGAIVPYAYYNSGYDQGVAAFYFSAATAPDWEQAYVVRISGNPEYFSSPPLTSHTLTASEYSQMGTQKENQTVLGNYILDVAKDLENNWSATLLFAGDLGLVLNSTGEAYFKGAIPGLQAMAPQIFPIQSSAPQYEETEWTGAQGEAYETRFEDTWVGEALASVGDLFRVKWNVITGLVVFVTMIGFTVVSQFMNGTVKPASISDVCVLLGGVVLGWMAPAIMGIIVILFALFLGYIWFFRHG